MASSPAFNKVSSYMLYYILNLDRDRIILCAEGVFLSRIQPQKCVHLNLSCVLSHRLLLWLTGRHVDLWPPRVLKGENTVMSNQSDHFTAPTEHIALVSWSIKYSNFYTFLFRLPSLSVSIALTQYVILYFSLTSTLLITRLYDSMKTYNIITKGMWRRRDLCSKVSLSHIILYRFFVIMSTS